MCAAGSRITCACRTHPSSRRSLWYLRTNRWGNRPAFTCRRMRRRLRTVARLCRPSFHERSYRSSLHFSPRGEAKCVRGPRSNTVFHESRVTAFFRVLRPSGGEKCRPGASRHETRLLPGARRKPARIPRFSRITNHETRITAFSRAETRPFPWLVWYRLVLKPFSLVFSAGMCSGLRVMTPLLGTETSSAPVGDVPAGDDKAAQATSFQVFTRPETRDTAIAWREAQAGANSEVFANHETRDPKPGFFQAPNTAFPWLAWYLLVLKPFSLFFSARAA